MQTPKIKIIAVRLSCHNLRTSWIPKILIGVQRLAFFEFEVFRAIDEIWVSSVIAETKEQLKQLMQTSSPNKSKKV
jgi:hypothetical protein